MAEAVKSLQRITRSCPEIIACDLHPGYLSTSLAEEISEKQKKPLFRIQHHHAHVASVAAEHGLSDYVGIAIDGLGYGEDGNLWGGEVFDVTDGIEFRRVGHLEEQPQIGGDSAANYPKKMLFGILGNFMEYEELLETRIFDRKISEFYLNQLHQKFNTPSTTSAGRVLDATSAYLNLCQERTYDGRPAMLLESVASKPYDLDCVFDSTDDSKIVMTTPLFRFFHDLEVKDPGKIAATAQMYLAKGLFEIAESVSRKKGKQIVVSGGVAYNRMITGYLIEKGVLINKEIPCGDGGICYGQAYLANLISR
jgi:hydrogenase maturation protein HypF